MGNYTKLSDEQIGKMLLCMALDDNTETQHFKNLVEEVKRRQKAD